jgi:hypothetical protein
MQNVWSKDYLVAGMQKINDYYFNALEQLWFDVIDIKSCFYDDYIIVPGFVDEYLLHGCDVSIIKHAISIELSLSDYVYKEVMNGFIVDIPTKYGETCKIYISVLSQTNKLRLCISNKNIVDAN